MPAYKMMKLKRRVWYVIEVKEGELVSFPRTPLLDEIGLFTGNGGVTVLHPKNGEQFICVCSEDSNKDVVPVTINLGKGALRFIVKID